MVTVLVRVVGPAVAHAVALGERPVEQYVLRFVLAQDLQPGPSAGQVHGQETTAHWKSPELVISVDARRSGAYADVEKPRLRAQMYRVLETAC
ncbi:hypothetical protein [Streptomyces sp. Wh19]|uniref:hypothetical protein n=1 Tax=Streptomyces sp. Wh19 TaxID=3076629 RepID=UPI003FA385A5